MGNRTIFILNENGKNKRIRLPILNRKCECKPKYKILEIRKQNE